MLAITGFLLLSAYCIGFSPSLFTMVKSAPRSQTTWAVIGLLQYTAYSAGVHSKFSMSFESMSAPAATRALMTFTMRGS